MRQVLLLVDYFRRQGNTWPKVRFVEESFRVQLGRYLLVGTLDRVDELPDGTLQIVDYKTARTPAASRCATTPVVVGPTFSAAC